MGESFLKFLQSSLTVLPFIIGGYAFLALIVGIRGVLIARNEAYRILHQDFLDMKDRVRKELRKN
jgi:hypothetical protein